MASWWLTNLKQINFSINIRLVRAPDKFLLLTKAAAASQGEDAYEYRIKLHELKLFYRKININSDLKVSIDSALGRGNFARYPINKTMIKFGQVIKGVQDYTFTPIHSGRLPYFCIAFLVSEESMMGHLGKNPFNAQVFGVESLSFSVNNVSLPTSAYTINDADSMEYLREYGVFLDHSAAGE